FLALSALLTGVKNLDPVVGRVYMNSLQASDEFDLTLEELYEQTGFDGDAPPQTIEELEARGLFGANASGGSDSNGGSASESGPSALADRILEYWYTGVYTTAEGEQAVATYVDALSWKTLAFTKPNSICATFGFWEARPNLVVPDVTA